MLVRNRLHAGHKPFWRRIAIPALPTDYLDKHIWTSNIDKRRSAAARHSIASIKCHQEEPNMTCNKLLSNIKLLARLSYCVPHVWRSFCNMRWISSILSQQGCITSQVPHFNCNKSTGIVLFSAKHVRFKKNEPVFSALFIYISNRANFNTSPRIRDSYIRH